MDIFYKYFFYKYSVVTSALVCFSFILFSKQCFYLKVLSLGFFWNLIDFASKKKWKKYRLTSEGIGRKNSENDKTVINTIYMQLDSLIIIKINWKSYDKMLKSLKFMLWPQVSEWSEITDCLTSLTILFVKCESPTCSAVLT